MFSRSMKSWMVVMLMLVICFGMMTGATFGWTVDAVRLVAPLALAALAVAGGMWALMLKAAKV